MKSTHPKITIFGSNSGRNVGDAAILSSILDSVSEEMPDAEFFVPSSNPDFVNKHYSNKYNVKGISFWPWTLSIRLIGLPTFLCVMKSDVALICDGIIFGKNLWNPFFNWLIQLVFVVPFAKLTGCKVVCYSNGIGPFHTKISATFTRFVLNLCDLVIMRENDSKKLAELIGVTKAIHVTGDAAFINKASDDRRALEIAKDEGIDLSKQLLGININSYVDAWLEKGEQFKGGSDFAGTICEAVKSAQAKTGHAFLPLVFSTHPRDEKIAYDLATRLNTKVVTNSKYLSHDLQCVMKRCELFLGMRFHSVVLAASVETPVIGLIYMPKVRGVMRDMGSPEYGIELSTISVDSLSDTIVKAWNERANLKARQKAVVDKLKKGARDAATMLREKIFPEYNKVSNPSHNYLKASGQ